MNKEYYWGVYGCGSIANELAVAMQSEGRKLYGVANRTPSRAKAFQKKYDVEHLYHDLPEMLEDEKIDIVYISTPHNTHIKYIVQALEHGKHVFCEKAITLNSTELTQAVSLARQKHLVLAEAMTLYHMPLLRKLEKIVQSGSFGKVQMITANFGSFKPYEMDNRFFNRTLAGGALLDIGVYALSFIRFFLEECPIEISSQVKYAASGADEQATIILMNAKEQMATAAISLHSKQPKRGMVSCEKGFIEIMNYPRGTKAVFTDAETGKTEEIRMDEMKPALFYEVLDMEKAVSICENNEMMDEKKDCQMEALMKLTYTVDVMNIMTAIRKDWGMKYPEEE